MFFNVSQLFGNLRNMAIPTGNRINFSFFIIKPTIPESWLIYYKSNTILNKI
jgi:hypothetical protein